MERYLIQSKNEMKAAVKEAFRLGMALASLHVCEVMIVCPTRSQAGSPDVRVAIGEKASASLIKSKKTTLQGINVSLETYESLKKINQELEGVVVCLWLSESFARKIENFTACCKALVVVECFDSLNEWLEINKAELIQV